MVYLYFYIERKSFMEKEMINRLKIVLAEEQKSTNKPRSEEHTSELQSH